MGARKAIITGSTKYTTSPLEYPIKDVTEMSKVLERRCQFNNNDIINIIHTDSLQNATFMSNIEGHCNKINKEKTDTYDLVVFYYSGHGFFDSAKGISCIQISDDHHISIDEIINCVTKIKSKNTYIIIDACQSGGFSFMGQPKGKVERQLSHNSKGLYLLCGTTKELLAFEPTTKDAIKRNIQNSFFTHFLIEALDKKTLYLENTLPIQVIDSYVSMKTSQYTNFDQIPASSSDTSGYFPFGFWGVDEDLEAIENWNIDFVDNSDSTLLSRETDMIKSIEECIIRLYTENKIYIFNHWDRYSLSKLSLPAKDLLNTNLNLTNKKYNEKPLINGLISTLETDQDKYHFLSCIFDLEEIEINVNLKDNNGQTALKEAFECKNNHLSSWATYMLFQRGYAMSSDEESELLEILSANSASQDTITNIAMSIIYKILNNNDDRSKSLKINKFLLSLLSLKYNRVIGSKLLNLTALSNNALQYYKEFSTIYLKACKKYGIYDELYKKPSFIRKIEQIHSELPFQESSYDDIINAIFPELLE